MSLAIIGKEFIIINEELAIYISFLIVLTILISNFGSVISNQFKEMANSIAQKYSQGSQEKHSFLLNYLTANYKSLFFINQLITFEIINTLKLLSLQGLYLNVIKESEIQL